MLSIMMAMWCGTLFARTAPVMPEPVPYVSGQTYYLYNVRAGKFLGGLSTSPTVLGIGYARKVRLIDNYQPSYNGTVVIFEDKNTFLIKSGGLSEATGFNYECTFTLAPTNNGYYLRSGYGNPYVGCTNNSYSLTSTKDTAAQVVWQLIAGDEDGDMYIARRMLFDLLEMADTVDYYTADYNAIYNNASSTIEQLTYAANDLRDALVLSENAHAASWNEYPIRFSSDGKWKAYNTSSTTLYTPGSLYNDSTKLSATFLVDTVSTISYNVEGGSYTTCYVYLDGALVRTLGAYEISDASKRWFQEVNKGVHTLTWRFVDMSGIHYNNYVFIREVGIQATPTITVDLLEPGSLGTEVLYQVNHIKDVRKLVVSGTLNDDDWEKIGMMTNLYSLDLSQAFATTIKANTFEGKSIGGDPRNRYLHRIILPQNVKTIGDRAFYNSFIDSISLPTTVQSIGTYAFSYSSIQEIAIPEGITTIPDRAFQGCYSLRNVTLPESVTSIGSSAFSSNHSLGKINLPDSLTEICSYAFSGCENAFDSIIIPDNVINIGNNAFQNCSKATYAKVPNLFWNIGNYNCLGPDIFYGCTGLRDVRLESSTVIVRESSRTIGATLSNITLHVPDYLVNSYKLDPYWYNAKAIVGFSTSERDNWAIYNDLTMNARDRYEGNPAIYHYDGKWKINGDSAMHLSHYDSWYSPFYSHYVGGKYIYDRSARVISTCPNITVDSATISAYAQSKQWQFLSMPIDFVVGDITPWEEGTMYVVYRYDGARRAANGAGSSWVRCADTDTIHVGEGFILQASQNSWMKFAAVNNTASNVFTSSDIDVPLQHHEAVASSNSNWNLVGNPYQCWYNNHMLNFTAPITVWNHSNRTYEAYSLSDDDYAIRPNEAFFVQCPDVFNSIGFPTTGRQFTNEIISQNAAPLRADAVAPEREIINLVISDGEMTDRTRLVYNEQASVAFESTCDAGKIMSMDNSVPQIYTNEADGEFAINERPLGDGIVMIGFYAPTDGEYTISALNCNEDIYLYDHELNIITNLSANDYSFSTSAGVDNARFTTQRHARGGIATDIIDSEVPTPIAFGYNGSIHIANMVGQVSVFTMEGNCVTEVHANGSPADIQSAAGIYLVRNNGTAIKVYVK